MIDTDGGHFKLETFESQLLHDRMLHRLLGLGAESKNPLVGVVAGERRQIHAADRPQQPSHLPFSLHRTSHNQALRAALDSAGVHANLFHPVQVERNPAIGFELIVLYRRRVRFRDAAFKVGFHRHTLFSITSKSGSRRLL